MKNMLEKETLVNYFLSDLKPKTNNKIGIELETFLYNKDNFSPYANNEINTLINSFGSMWQKVFTDGYLSGLTSNIGNISLEPGFQFEFSSIPVGNLNILEQYYNIYLKELSYILNKQNGSTFSLGHHPYLYPENTPFFNKKRYMFMFDYMPKVGSLGRNMMKNTCTLQINYDFNSELDLGKKIRVLSTITPFLVYLSGNSPFKNSEITNFLSYRNEIWDHTDEYRTGMPSIFFDDNFSVEKYVDYLLGIPIYFVIRNNQYIFDNKYSFKDLIEGKNKNIQVNLDDFILHSNTVFPDIRIKKYLEVRSCDSMNFDTNLAIPAFLTGILYDNESLDHIYYLTKSWTKLDFLAMKKHLNTQGLTNTTFNNISLTDFSKELFNASLNGLYKRNLNEEKFLAPIEKIISNRINQSQEKKLLFNSVNQDIKKLITKISLI